MDPEVNARAEEITGHRFTDGGLLETALTHPSFAAENQNVHESYDRLEFLGDAVLGFVTASELYQALPGAPEGDLTRRKHEAVSGTMLAHVAESLGIGELLRLGKGARSDRRRASVLENTFEALVGALYLDGGIDVARRFVLASLAEPMFARVPRDDPKSALQELTQARFGVLPAYRIVSADGPPHDRVFTAEVSVTGDTIGSGSGTSKQLAEKAAAAEALDALESG